MCEASIILPLKDNDGRERSDVHTKLETQLVEFFNGCTVTYGTGAWAHDGVVQREPVAIYTVAAEDDRATGFVLGPVARAHARMMGQKAVYWRDFLGSVHIDTL